MDLMDNSVQNIPGVANTSVGTDKSPSEPTVALPSQPPVNPSVSQPQSAATLPPITPPQDDKDPLITSQLPDKPPLVVPPQSAATLPQMSGLTKRLPPVEEPKLPLKENRTAKTFNQKGWVAGPVIMVLCLGFAFYNFSRVPSAKNSLPAPSQQPQIMVVSPELTIGLGQKKTWDKWLTSIPKNPDNVVAKASEGEGVAELASGEIYSYPNPVFTWSGATPQEAGTEIVGYYVYFGEKKNLTTYPAVDYKEATDPQKEGIYQESNTFVAKDLEVGKTYYLFVQAVSNSQNKNYRVGYSVVNRELYETRPADVLFEYRYE
jgi:hypothetical protein